MPCLQLLKYHPRLDLPDHHAALPWHAEREQEYHFVSQIHIQSSQRYWHRRRWSEPKDKRLKVTESDQKRGQFISRIVSLVNIGL